MHFYAQIRDGVVRAVTETAGPVVADDMIPIHGYDTGLLGMLYDGQQFVAAPEQPSGVPQSVTMRQARLALLAAGKLSEVDAAINALPEPERSAARITWDYSTEVQRNNGLVSQLAPALGLDDAALDALFTQAALL